MVIDFVQAVGRIRPARVVRSARIADLIEPWCASRRADGFQKSGIDRYHNQVTAFARWAGEDATLVSMSEASIRAYKVEFGNRCGPGTTRNALTALRSFCDWLLTEGHLKTNPALLVDHPTVALPPPNPLTREELAQLLAAIDIPPQSHKATYLRNRRAILTMLYAGSRRAETAALLWGDADLSRREIIVRQGKGGKSRVVPICDELADEYLLENDRTPTHAIVNRTDGEPMGHDCIGHIFERWLPRRGITVTPHQLRRTFATELYRRGEDLFTIQRLLGHSDPKTTLRYIGASSEKEHEAVNKLTLRADLMPNKKPPVPGGNDG